MNFNFLKLKNIFFAISGAAVIVSIVFFAMWGLNYSIEFSPGSVLKVEFQNQRPENAKITQALESFKLNEQMRLIGDKGVEISYKGMKNEAEKVAIKESLNEVAPIDEGKTYIEEIDPIVGNIITNKTIWAIVISIIVAIAFIAMSFRGVSRYINSWYYGIAAALALCHDIIIPIGIMSYLGHFYNVQFGLPIVAALLTIFGYSINDTIIVYDRIRENLLRKPGPTVEETMNRSINETWWRSLATTLTTMLPLIVLYTQGGDELRYFSLVLLVGIFLGAYSSIFIASPLLLFVAKQGGAITKNKK